MKLKTAVISIVVSASLVAGGGYGAYCVYQGQKKPIEVVPVSSVNQGSYYWGDMGESIYGTVTSRIAQNVVLDSDYPLDKIYVKQGDKVSEGTPLFSYDMTFQELELEMAQLNLQTKGLTLTKLKKDLEKLQKMAPSASLQKTDDTKTTASGEEDSLADYIEDVPSGQETSAKPDSEPETSGSTGSGSSFVVEGVEEVDKEESQQLPAVESVAVFERLVDAIDDLFKAYEEELRADEVGDAVEEAVTYFRKHLAEEKITEETGEDGTKQEIREYRILDHVKETLGEKDTENLKKYRKKLDHYQLLYVQMFIRDTYENMEELEGEELSGEVDRCRKAYDLLATKLQEEVENYEILERLEELTADSGNEETESESEEPGSETGESGKETEESGNETEESGKETEETGMESETSGPESESEETEEPSTEDRRPQHSVVLMESGKILWTDYYREGDLVSVTARNEEDRVFKKWETDPATLVYTHRFDGKDSYTMTFEMPEEDVTVTEVYSLLPSAAMTYVNGFKQLYDTAMSGQTGDSVQLADQLENAVIYYQQWLGEVKEAVLDQPGSDAPYSAYTLKTEIAEYLKQEGDKKEAQRLQEQYKELCIQYMQTLMGLLNIYELDEEILERACGVYSLLGEWKEDAEERWMADHEPKDEDEDTTVLSIEDTLAACRVLIRFQQYQAVAGNLSESERISLLTEIMYDYTGLTDQQKTVLDQYPEFIETMKDAGLWEQETETESEWYDPDWGGDFGGDFEYTAEELKELIEDKEYEIKSCELEEREIQLDVNKKQRVVDKKVVKSSMDGTVISVGNLDGSSDGDYFVKVANTAGLYAKGSMSELDLEKIHVGDTISGMMTNTGASFTAVIKEISEYPDQSGDNYFYGYSSGNSNASHYSFYALLDDTTDIEEGEAEIQLASTMSFSSDSLYLENYFVRAENDGRNYVYIEGEDGLLKKQYVTTGKSMSNWAIEIVEGLSTEDKIAFPYGKDVNEGAATKEVDMLNLY